MRVQGGNGWGDLLKTRPVDGEPDSSLPATDAGSPDANENTRCNIQRILTFLTINAVSSSA